MKTFFRNTIFLAALCCSCASDACQADDTGCTSDGQCCTNYCNNGICAEKG